MLSGKTISLPVVFLTFLVACDSRFYELTYKRTYVRPNKILGTSVRTIKVRGSFRCLEKCGYLFGDNVAGKLCCYFDTVSMECECLTWKHKQGAGRLIASSERAWCSTENLMCQQWARYGECKRNPHFMLMFCRFACTFYADPSFDKVCVRRILFSKTQSRAYNILNPCKRT